MIIFRAGDPTQSLTHMRKCLTVKRDLLPLQCLHLRTYIIAHESRLIFLASAALNVP